MIVNIFQKEKIINIYIYQICLNSLIDININENFSYLTKISQLMNVVNKSFFVSLFQDFMDKQRYFNV
jgi:hypothetical protein